MADAFAAFRGRADASPHKPLHRQGAAATTTMAAPATPATPASYGDDFEDDFEPETPGVQAPAPAAAADDGLGNLLDAILDAPDAAPEAAAAPEPEPERQPSDEAKEDVAAPETQEPPRAYADTLLLEAKEDHAAHLAELRHAHGAHFLLRLRQFLSIARADRAGVDPRDDAGDQGLLGPSRGQGPQNSLARSEPCLEAMAGLWRTFESQYEDDRTASLSTETARWSPAHEHQFLLFRSGCRADPGRSSLRSMSRHKTKGLGGRDPSHAATVAAKPINLMTNFLTARTDVVADLDRQAYKDSSKTDADRENFVDAVIELIEGRRRRMLDDFDETQDDCRVVSRVSRAATFCARLSHAVRTRRGRRFTDVHDLFGKRARLRPKARTQEDETTYTFPELLLGTALLNVPYSVWEARDFFASVGGKVGQPADLGMLEGIFVAFWLEVAARRGKYKDPDDEPAWADCKSPVVETKDPELRRFRAARDAVASAAADLHLTWEKTESDDEATEPSRPQAPGYMRNWNPGKQLKRGLEVQSDADYASKTEGLVKAEHLLHRRNLLAQKYIDLRSAFNRRMVAHMRPSSSGLTRPLKNLKAAFATSPIRRPKTADTGALRRRRDLAAALRRNERAEVLQRDFGAEAKMRRRKKAEANSREISRKLAQEKAQRKLLGPKTPLKEWIPSVQSTSVPKRLRPSSAPSLRPPWNKRVPQSAHKEIVVEKPKRRRRKVKGAPKDRAATHGWRARAPKAKDPPPVLPACLFPMSKGILPGLYAEPPSSFKLLV